MDHLVKNPESLRERQRRETRERIMQTGLRLFTDRGYDETTLDAIAEASGIARRTVFNYFNSKEDIILAWQEGLPDALRVTLIRQGMATSPLNALCAGLITLAQNMHSDVAVMVTRIVRSTEQLRAANQAKFLKMELTAFEALETLWPDDAHRDRLQLIAMIGIGALRLAVDAWTKDDGTRPLADHLAATFGHLDHALDDP